MALIDGESSWLWQRGEIFLEWVDGGEKFLGFDGGNCMVCEFAVGGVVE